MNIKSMPSPKQPPVHEREFIKVAGNHNEFQRKLATLSIAAPEFTGYTAHICLNWFRLAEAHLAESKLALAANCQRATLSRAYYAAYNASKSVRYLAQGAVSLKGDDHGKASQELPGDLPNVAQWAQRITTLYENRLRADYDNWSSTSAEFTLTPERAVAEAESFLAEVRMYLITMHGMAL